ncbi:MAG: hypothetical protein K0B52_03400, partial [FCB group bacterium]|nr:hypothetical protein [FCB group bacterium]
MKINAHIFLIAFFSFLTASPFQQMQSDPVHVYFQEQDRNIAASALQTVRDQQNRLYRQYGLELRTVHVFIAPDAAAYSALAGSASPLWSGGLASGDRMLIKSPAFSRQTLPAFHKTLRHETVHLALSGHELPVWFEEGLAQYESGTFGIAQKVLLGRAAWQQSFIPFSEIEHLTRMGAREAELAYAQSVAAVDHMIRYFGVELLGKSLDLSKNYEHFPTGFRNAFLMTPVEFERHWQEQAKKRYRIYVLLD